MISQRIHHPNIIRFLLPVAGELVGVQMFAQCFAVVFGILAVPLCSTSVCPQWEHTHMITDLRKCHMSVTKVLGKNFCNFPKYNAPGSSCTCSSFSSSSSSSSLSFSSFSLSSSFSSSFSSLSSTSVSGCCWSLSFSSSSVSASSAGFSVSSVLSSFLLLTQATNSYSHPTQATLSLYGIDWHSGIGPITCPSLVRMFVLFFFSFLSFCDGESLALDQKKPKKNLTICLRRAVQRLEPAGCPTVSAAFLRARFASRRPLKVTGLRSRPGVGSGMDDEWLMNGVQEPLFI